MGANPYDLLTRSNQMDNNNLTRALQLIKEAEHYLSQNMNDLAHVDILEAMYLLGIKTKEMDQQHA